MSDLAIPIGVTVILIALNGLFVAAEFAIAGVSRPAIARRAAEGHRTARVVERILSSPRNQDRYIATAQLGITFASLGLGMYAEHQFATRIYDLFNSDGFPTWLASHAIASIAALALMTYFHIVLGEMVPKALALQHAEGTAIWVTPMMSWIQRVLFPLVVALNGIGNGILRLMGIRREIGSEQFYTAEELEFIVRESAEKGTLASEPARVLRELFEFGSLTAEDVMVPRVRVVGIPLGATPEDLRTLIPRDGHTRYPVYDGNLDHIVGMLHIKDLMRIAREGRNVDRSEARPVPLLPETAKVDTVLATMRRERTQLVVVMDEHGGTAGIISLEDLFEEVVGEFDEATGQPEPEEVSTGRIMVDGTTRIEEAGERVGLVLTHDEVETVSGVVLSILDRPPVVGDSVVYEGVRFTVTEVEGYGVSRCEVELVEPPMAVDTP